MVGARAARAPRSEPRDPEDRSATYREVFAVAEFRFLFVAYLLSLAGDQLAKVALTILVFDRTGSAALAAVTFAVGYLPWLLGGPLLSVYADRWPRRQVMIGCDLIRMVLILALVVPGMPLWAMVGLLFVSNLFTPPFEAARAATTPEVLAGDRYAIGLAVSNVSAQLAQVLGFLGGAALVLLLSARGALLVDALTFAVSALLLVVGLRPRAAPSRTDRPDSLWGDARAGVAVVFGPPRLRLMIVMLWAVCALNAAPEGLAAAYAAALGGGPGTVGLLLAANPAGMVLGGLLITRLARPSRREALTLPLAGLSVGALVPVVFVDDVPVVAVLLLLSGVGLSFLIPLNVWVVRHTPPIARARAFGLIASGLQAAQGLAVVIAGVVGDQVGPAPVVAGAGVIGLFVVAWTALRRRSTTAPAPVDGLSG